MGKAICTRMLDSPDVKNQAPEDLHLEGGPKVRHRYVTPYPPVPPPYSTDKGGEGKNCSMSDPLSGPLSEN